MPTIKLENASKYYKVNRARRRHDGRRFEIGVEQVDLSIHQGEFVFIIGSSGAGKSTLLDLITGKIAPDRGRVTLNGRDLRSLTLWSRNRTALLFGKVCQEPTLIRKMSVEDNLMVAAQVGKRRKETPQDLEKRIKKVLALVGMRGSEERFPMELSVGECRRVELARAMINSPPILVLDEITANLDDDSIWDIFLLLNELNQRGTTIIMVTHASRYVNIMCRRVITLVDGRVFGDVKKGRYGDVV